jgi:hypothetical protein
MIRPTLIVRGSHVGFLLGVQHNVRECNVRTESVEGWRSEDRMARRGQTVRTPLVTRNEQQVELLAAGRRHRSYWVL